MDVPEYHALVREFMYQEAGRRALSGVLRLSSTSFTPAASPPLLVPPRLAPARRHPAQRAGAGGDQRLLGAGRPELTVNALADRLQLALDPAPSACSSGWGVGGVVAEALAARSAARRAASSRSTSLAPGVRDDGRPSPSCCAPSRCTRRPPRPPARRRPRAPPRRPRAGARAHPRGGLAAGALRAGTPPATFRRCYATTPAGCAATTAWPPATRPRAPADRRQGRRAHSHPRARALGWDRFGPVEVLASGGDHYTMLTDPSAAPHLADAPPALAGPGLRRRVDTRDIFARGPSP